MSYENPRIKDLNRSLLEVLTDFSEGNPGAIRVLCELVKSAEVIDPDSAMGSWSPLFSLDNLDCYGSRIWMFYKDVCGQNIATMHGLMRASQLGFTSDREINAAISGDKAALDIPELIAKVKERLPKFDAKTIAA